MSSTVSGEATTQVAPNHSAERSNVPKLIKALGQLAEHFGADRPCSVSREISKLHEETVRGTLESVAAHFEEHGVKGECVVVLGGKPD